MSPRDLLKLLNAPQHLVRHLELLSEAAASLTAGLAALGLNLDADWIARASMLHDLGKILHPEELLTPGHAHEEAGYKLAIAHGQPESLASICRTHASWQYAQSLEALTVALADKLWKGKRDEALEAHFIAQASARLNQDPWTLYIPLDDLFEQVAADGPARLKRSST